MLKQNPDYEKIFVNSCFLFQLTISAQQAFISDKLTKKWQTPGELKMPESICYDPQQNLLFVSNIAGGPSDKDNNGFISHTFGRW